MTTYQIQKINEFIDKNYKRKNIISEIANNFHYRYQWVIREYKRISGRTIGSYITEKRLEEIRRNLEDGNDIIKSIKLSGQTVSGPSYYTIAEKYKERYGETFKETKAKALEYLKMDCNTCPAFELCSTKCRTACKDVLEEYYKQEVREDG